MTAGFGFQAVRVECDVFGRIAGLPHFDGNALSRVMKRDQTRTDFSPQGVAAGKLLFVDEAHKAARTVAAVLDLATIGVEDAVAKVGFRMQWVLDQQNLVCTHAKMAVRKRPRPFGRHFYGLPNA